MPGADIAYSDERHDDTTFTMSAVIAPVYAWRDSFLGLQEYRKHLGTTYGMITAKRANLAAV